MLFARIHGLDWTCPSCGALHKTHIGGRYKALYCTTCKTIWYPGVVLHKAPMGPKPLVPRDSLMISGGFTLKREANLCFCSRCSEEITPSIIDTMLHHKTPSKP